jgi:hypothetical protein
MVPSFEDITTARKEYYSDLFKVPLGCPINEILKVVSLFPKLVSEEENESMQRRNI